MAAFTSGAYFEFANFTLPTLKTFLEARSQNFWRPVHNLLLVSPNDFFFHELAAIFWSAKKRRKDTFFPTLHPLSLVFFTTAAVVAFILLRNYRFNFRCCEATPTQKSARKWRCDLWRLLARKLTKGIHSCKPASLNRPYCTLVSTLHCQANNCRQHKQKDEQRAHDRLWTGCCARCWSCCSWRGEGC